MGFLSRLMFWKDKTVELEYDVEGCFTLPETQEPNTETETDDSEQTIEN